MKTKELLTDHAGDCIELSIDGDGYLGLEHELDGQGISLYLPKSAQIKLRDFLIGLELKHE